MPVAGHEGSPALAEEIRRHVLDRLAKYMYPRWLEFVPGLPKSSTGKIHGSRRSIRSLSLHSDELEQLIPGYGSGFHLLVRQWDE